MAPKNRLSPTAGIKCPLLSLLRTAPCEFSEHSGFDGRFVEAPSRTDKIVRRCIAADAIDDHRRRQQFDKIDQRADILGPLHQLHFAARYLIRQRCVLHAIQIVNLHRIDAELAQFAGCRQHVVMRFARQPQNRVCADFETAPAASRYGIDHRIVMMPAVHPIERAVVHRLHAVLDGKIRTTGKLFQQIEHIIRHAIGSRANHESDDLRMRKRFFVNGAQSLDRRIRIRRRLKVREKVVAFAIPHPHPFDALIDLAANAGAWQSAAGAEAAVIAKRAAPRRYRAVHIGAGKAGIDADLLYPPAKTLPEEEVAGEVRQSGSLPCQPGIICRKWFG